MDEFVGKIEISLTRLQP